MVRTRNANIFVEMSPQITLHLIHFKANDNEKNSIFQISLSNKSVLSHASTFE